MLTTSSLFRKPETSPHNIMKHHHLFTALAGLCLSAALQAQTPRYRLVWQDDFKGRRLDNSSWAKIPRGLSAWNRHMSDHESLYAVRRGKLILHGRVNDGIAPTDTARYITGGVFTKGLRTVCHGKVEVRAKLEGAQGAWPAIWMLPADAQWPYGGEIDIMERLNHDTKVYQTIHTQYTYILGHEDEPPHGSTAPIDPKGYNIYAVEILPDSLVFSVNGQHTFTYPRIQTQEPGQFPFGTPFYLLIDMQVEGTWVGPAKPEEYPVEMKVDWVRMYELIP